MTLLQLPLCLPCYHDIALFLLYTSNKYAKLQKKKNSLKTPMTLNSISYTKGEKRDFIDEY